MKIREAVKRSIKRQMILVFAGLICFALLTIFVLNQAFLERYYIIYKEKDLKTVYQMINKAEDAAELTDILNNDAWPVLEKSNISILVRDQSGSALYRETTGAGSKLLAQQLIANMLEKSQKGRKVLEETAEYQISRAMDLQNHSEYVEMWGVLNTGYWYIMRIPLESIRDSVALTGRFLIFGGLGIILTSAVLIWYFSKRITDPILELAQLSKQMANLDFDASYTRGGDDEIAVLGENFNTMSQELKKAVSDLKNANYELQKDIEKKEKIETMRTEFLGNVSHELKTPLALIQGYAEGLKEGISDDPESREFYCDVIMDEASKMNKMVKNLLTLNQLEFGKNEVQFERFDIAELIQGVLESMRILMEQKEVKLSFLHEGPVYVWADEFLIEQVVRNYVSNAIHHVDSAKIIEVKIKQTDKARISVFNTGQPIPEEDISQIWDKFYKVDKARTREYGGNGIGLSIVKATMDSLKQGYGVKNYDNGVEFWFELDVK